MSQTVTTTIYTIDELSDDAKQRAIDKWIEHDDLPFLSDDMAEYLTSVLLPKYKFKCDDPQIYYSLSYCQGDGAMFTGTVEWGAWRVEIRQNGHYYHYNSKQFWNAESIKTGKDMTESASAKFNDAYVALCRELERYGYDLIESAHDPENVAETIRANDYQFYANGDVYYER